MKKPPFFLCQTDCFNFFIIIVKTEHLWKHVPTVNKLTGKFEITYDADAEFLRYCCSRAQRDNFFLRMLRREAKTRVELFEFSVERGVVSCYYIFVQTGRRGRGIKLCIYKWSMADSRGNYKNYITIFYDIKKTFLR